VADGVVIAERYRLDERLGAGAMSEVWRATDLELERLVAIKLLGRDADPARFEREARSAAALGHPNIVQVFDYGTHESRPFMVLEYLPGGTLDERLTPGEVLPDEETAVIARDIAAGLAHAHGRGLVHRDLKPGNILFDSEGRAKIADLGIARMSGAGTLTEAGTVLGTAAYISPEQARGEPATPASDVYSFGVVVFLLLTGRLPFESSDPMELVRMHLNEPAPPVEAFRSDAPARLESLAAAAMAKDARDRPPDGAALLAELEPTAAATTVLAPPQATQTTHVVPAAAAVPPTAGRPAPPWRAFAIVGAALALAVAGVAVAVIATRDDGAAPAAPLPSLSIPTSKRDATTEATTEETTTEAATTKRQTTAESPPPPPPPTPPTTTTVPTTLPTESVPTEPPPPPPPPPTTVPTESVPPPPPPPPPPP
jgi:serine/threonine-protein kinase